jgi:hypothetical protein
MLVTKSRMASGHSGIRRSLGEANRRCGFCASIRTPPGELFSAADFSASRSRAWYCRSIFACRRPYLPLIAASATRAMSEKTSTQYHGESVSDAAFLLSVNSIHHGGHRAHGGGRERIQIQNFIRENYTSQRHYPSIEFILIHLCALCALRGEFLSVSGKSCRQTGLPRRVVLRSSGAGCTWPCGRCARRCPF